MITGRELVEKMYSENEEIQEEKLYSTGDDELDDLFERAFCDGYEYAQKEFGIIKDTYNQLMRDHKVKGIKKDLKAAREDFRLGNLDVARRYKFDLENFGKEPAILQQKVGKQLIKDRYAGKRDSILDKVKAIGTKYKKPTK